MEATKTDLRLLLECLKYQMKWPGSQKQALLTIISICKQNGQYVEFFREIGGISFIYNLSKSSTFSQVKETALFMLASLAELHESCKQSLCREETFCDLAQHLEQKMPLTEKRVAVYMLSVLVANNSTEVDRLLLRPPGVSKPCSVCSEENQNACMHVFPLVKTWLQEVALPRPELAQPICSFIGMTVANNPCAQQYFVSVGGLDSLSDTLTRVLSQSAHSAPACKVATAITKTLSACISNNGQLVSSLSKSMVIPGLLCLLSSPNLDPQDQLAVVLTIGYLTDACFEFVVEHQSQLLSAGGLPIMILLLTETSDEEVRKAAMFVLHTCKRISELHIGVKLWERDTKIQQRSNLVASSVECNEAWWEGSVMRKLKGYHRVCGELHTTPAGTLERPITNEIPYSKENLVRMTCKHINRNPDIFRHPDPMKRNQCPHTRSDDEMSLCSELLDREINRFLKTPSASKPSSLRCAGIRLTPLRRPSEIFIPGIKKNMVHSRLKKTSEDCLPKNSSGRHRERRNFSADELLYLNMGVKRFGHSWNSILWTYPFQPGRTNVDLAKKYQHMQARHGQ
ncbi:hypothetical protein cypCar_00014906 [Cyprinus carpio]|nr:hypothetical protein cypCar_00014906 [Cyprinus carpio]